MDNEFEMQHRVLRRKALRAAALLPVFPAIALIFYKLAGGVWYFKGTIIVMLIVVLYAIHIGYEYSRKVRRLRDEHTRGNSDIEKKRSNTLSLRR